ncbi:MAG: aspartyl protease family protein [Phycisphaerales bacterium]|nr:aspartyl protease family protein [Phycisphaerales bacterium]
MPASLPLRGFRDTPLLEARIDGVGPVTVVLDTGSSACVVSPELAEQLPGRTRPTRRMVINAEGQRLEAMGEIPIRRLELGVAVFEEVDAIVADLASLKRAYGEPIAAIVGYPLFRDLPLTIDFAARQVSIESARGGQRVRVVDSQLPIVAAEVEGHAVEVLIDSGSSSGWAVPIEKIAFEPGSRASKAVLMLGGSSAVEDGRLDGKARIGVMEFDRPVIESTRGLARVGVRGLEGLRVTFDQVNGAVWLERVRELPVQMPRGIGAEFRATGSTWELWSVEPGLPAHQVGLRDGERVLSIDGLRIGQMGTSALHQRMEQAARLRLEVLRPGGVETVWVPIVSLER